MVIGKHGCNEYKNKYAFTNMQTLGLTKIYSIITMDILKTYYYIKTIIKCINTKMYFTYFL